MEGLIQLAKEPDLGVGREMVNIRGSRRVRHWILLAINLNGYGVCDAISAVAIMFIAE